MFIYKMCSIETIILTRATIVGYNQRAKSRQMVGQGVSQGIQVRLIVLKVNRNKIYPFHRINRQSDWPHGKHHEVFTLRGCLSTYFFSVQHYLCFKIFLDEAAKSSRTISDNVTCIRRGSFKVVKLVKDKIVAPVLILQQCFSSYRTCLRISFYARNCYASTADKVWNPVVNKELILRPLFWQNIIILFSFMSYTYFHGRPRESTRERV